VLKQSENAPYLLLNQDRTSNDQQVGSHEGDRKIVLKVVLIRRSHKPQLEEPLGRDKHCNKDRKKGLERVPASRIPLIPTWRSSSPCDALRIPFTIPWQEHRRSLNDHDPVRDLPWVCRWSMLHCVMSREGMVQQRIVLVGFWISILVEVDLLREQGSGLIHCGGH